MFYCFDLCGGNYFPFSRDEVLEEGASACVTSVTPMMSSRGKTASRDSQEQAENLLTALQIELKNLDLVDNSNSRDLSSLGLQELGTRLDTSWLPASSTIVIVRSCERKSDLLSSGKV